VERLLRTDRRELSLVDCSSFELMYAGGIRQALALDDDFEKEGYRLLPRR
jgi:predicted nucleic acid-binding protein